MEKYNLKNGDYIENCNPISLMTSQRNFINQKKKKLFWILGELSSNGGMDIRNEV